MKAIAGSARCYHTVYGLSNLTRIHPNMLLVRLAREGGQYNALSATEFGSSVGASAKWTYLVSGRSTAHCNRSSQLASIICHVHRRMHVDSMSADPTYMRVLKFGRFLLPKRLICRKSYMRNIQQSTL